MLVLQLLILCKALAHVLRVYYTKHCATNFHWYVGSHTKHCAIHFHQEGRGEVNKHVCIGKVREEEEERKRQEKGEIEELTSVCECIGEVTEGGVFWTDMYRPQLCISSTVTVLGFATSLSIPPSPPTTSTLRDGDEGMKEKEGRWERGKKRRRRRRGSVKWHQKSIQHQHTAKCLATINSDHSHERGACIYDWASLIGDTILRNRHIAYSNITTNFLENVTEMNLWETTLYSTALWPLEWHLDITKDT